MARHIVGQMTFNFNAPPPAPVDATPKWFRTMLDKNYSYVEIGIMRNDNGTWSASTRDSFQGFCGHGGPFWGEYASFNAALANRLDYLRRGYQAMVDGHAGSCCTDKHKAMARKGMKWLDELAAEYDVAH